MGLKNLENSVIDEVTGKRVFGAWRLFFKSSSFSATRSKEVFFFFSTPAISYEKKSQVGRRATTAF